MSIAVVVVIYKTELNTIYTELQCGPRDFRMHPITPCYMKKKCVVDLCFFHLSYEKVLMFMYMSYWLNEANCTIWVVFACARDSWYHSSPVWVKSLGLFSASYQQWEAQALPCRDIRHAPLIPIYTQKQKEFNLRHACLHIKWKNNKQLFYDIILTVIIVCFLTFFMFQQLLIYKYE